jgi:hypothetical protein
LRYDPHAEFSLGVLAFQGMERESQRRELWHQLDNESERAHQAFKVYMYLPPGERTLIAAWRRWGGNPESKREPPYFREWAAVHAWQERARAHDHHLELIRERGIEEAVEEEAREQAKAIEKLHWRYQELMALGYQRAMEYLEDEDFIKHMRPADVIALIRLHFEGVQKLAEPGGADEGGTVDWSEDEQRELDRIVGEIESEEAQEEPEEGSSEEDSESDHSEGTEEAG